MADDEVGTVRVRFLINARGYHYGEVADVVEADWVWVWFGQGLCELVDDDDYAVSVPEAVAFSELLVPVVGEG